MPWLHPPELRRRRRKSRKSSPTEGCKEKSEKKTSKGAIQEERRRTAKVAREKADKKTKVEKEKEYALDLAKNGQVALSVVLKYTKMGIKLKDVKSIELADEKDKKRIRWEKDEDNEGDYILTVLKNFKELRLRIVTKKSSKLLVLKNGAKNARGCEKAKLQKAEESKTMGSRRPKGEGAFRGKAGKAREGEQEGGGRKRRKRPLRMEEELWKRRQIRPRTEALLKNRSEKPAR